MTATGGRGFQVRALGEIALRCRDFEAMIEFYRETLGLSPLEGGHREGIRFFALGESYGGHTAVLALFSGNAPVAGDGSSLHHLALSLGAEEQKAAMAWFDALALPYRVEDFPWIGWRGVFVTDPDGNTVELVARV